MNTEDKVLLPGSPLSRLEEIEYLQNQIWTLQEEDAAENRQKILPFLQSQAVCRWDSYYGLTVEPFNKQGLDELIELIQGKQNRGYNHFGCEIAKNVSIRYDDGHISLHFIFDGEVKLTEKETVKAMKELGLKIDFSLAKANIQKMLDGQNKKLQALLDLEKEFNSTVT